jgi:pyridoxal phosphate enzyme (YggS family)
MNATGPGARREEIAAGLHDVRRRMDEAATAAGRSPDDVTLVVVTKFFPASDVRLLAGLGVTDVGENRHPEAGAKLAECRDLGLRWHFIGGLQSNKATVVASYADVIESVDRVKLVRALDRGAHGRSHPVDVLLQLSLDEQGHEGRSGAEPGDLRALAEAVDAAGMLRLRGLMAVAPLGEEPGAAFRRLADVRTPFLADHPDAAWLSAGMSNDFEAAIEAGATHVRVGSAILGARPGIK